MAARPVLNRASMLVDAAIDGQGVALAHTTLAAWDLISGRIFRPFDLSWRPAGTYWIVSPKATSKLAKIGRFRDTQGFGHGVAAMNANAIRMVAGAGGGLVAIYALNLGLAGFFAAVAAGFCIYATLLVRTVIGVKTPASACTATS